MWRDGDVDVCELREGVECPRPFNGRGGVSVSERMEEGISPT